MPTSEQILDELPDETPPDVADAIAELLGTETTSLQLDESIEVIVARGGSPGLFEESHFHTTDDYMIMHLRPEEARIFDRKIVKDFLGRMMLDDLDNGAIGVEADYGGDNE